MPPPKKVDLTEAKRCILQAVQELKLYQGDVAHVVLEELNEVIKQLEHLSVKCDRVEELARFRNRGYAIVDAETGVMRQASPDEVRRIIMRYPKQGVNILDILRQQNELIHRELTEKLGQQYEEFIIKGYADVDSRPSERTYPTKAWPEGC